MTALRVAVTGSTGFLGAHVCAASRKAGHEVIALSRRPLTEQGEVHADLLDEASLAAAMEQARPDVLVHCAAYGVDARQNDLGVAVATNVGGTFALYRAASVAGVRAIVHIGTGYEYGPVDELAPVPETTPLRPIGVYGSTRAAASMLLRGVHASLAPSVALLRPFGMLGPGEGDHKLIPQVVRACVERQPLPMTGGTEVRDYVAARAVAEAISAVALPAAGQSVGLLEMNLCSGQPVTIAALARMVATHLGQPGVPRPGELPSRPSALPYAVGDPTKWRAWCAQHGVADPLQALSILSEVDAMAADYARRNPRIE
jgi:nucleoside-diphosphate-sugar epimerase